MFCLVENVEDVLSVLDIFAELKVLTAKLTWRLRRTYENLTQETHKTIPQTVCEFEH